MQDKQKAYSRQKNRLAIVNLVLSPGILVLFIIMGLATNFSNLSAIVSANDYINLVAFFLIISVVYGLAMLPLKYYSGFVLEHKYSLSNQTIQAWITRELKRCLVSFIITIPMLFSLYAFVRYHPLYWWIYTALLWFGMSILLAKFLPILILPLFYKYSPIKNLGLKERLINLAAKVGFKAENVYEINMSKDTKKANAAVVGLGKHKRIVLCDTLLQNFNDDEIECVMGHELGHHKMKHILKTILFGGVVTIITFYATDLIFLKLHSVAGYRLLYDFESLVLIGAILTTLNTLFLPLHNAFSRKLEQNADAFALKITGKKSPFISTMKKLADQNLADPKPAAFYEIVLYNHPPIAKRISFAESFKGIS